MGAGGVRVHDGALAAAGDRRPGPGEAAEGEAGGEDVPQPEPGRGVEAVHRR